MQNLTLTNFKSYQHQAIHKFSPHINVILGNNGKGKSNFFKAFLFLLSDKI